MPGHVEVNRAGLQRALAASGGAWGNRVGRQVQNAAKRRAPVDEGRLRSSIGYNVSILPTQVRVRIGSSLAYARYVHEGTGIYGPRRRPIVPVTAKALKFEPGRSMGPRRRGASAGARGRRGGPVFAASVKGSPPNPFLADALEEVMGRTNTTRRTP